MFTKNEYFERCPLGMSDNEWGTLYLCLAIISTEDTDVSICFVFGDAIAAEIRHTGILLKHFDIKTFDFLS